MLEPQDRQQLLESLRPPTGYSLDYAVGTTYSLDLLALLTAPLAFTFFDWEDEDGRPTPAPQALLAAIRKNADKIALFCQAGQIAVPGKYQLLYNYLKDTVVQVSVKKGNPKSKRGVFHPKVWVLRYVADNEPAVYRFLCMSRNLTFDRSWDTMLVLDGSLIERQRVFANNRPISLFLETLPGLSLSAVPERVRSKIKQMSREILKVEFDLPEGFEEVKFWPLGITGASKWPFVGRIDRMLVISPFLTPELLHRLSEHGEKNILISRPEFFQEIPSQTLRQFKRVYCLSPGAEAEPDEDINKDNTEQEDESLQGLHAKTYIADAGWYARVWTGSANASNAAFGANVEFLTELVGPKSQCGIDTLLKKERGQTNFVDLLEEFSLAPVSESPDPTAKHLEGLLQDARMAIAGAGFFATIVSSSQSGEFALAISCEEGRKLAIPDQVTLTCRPISLHESAAQPLLPRAEIAVRFTPISFAAITPFFAFTSVAVSRGERMEQRFVLNLPLENLPADWQEKLLLTLLQSRSEVLQLILLLLLDKDITEGSSDNALSPTMKWAWGNGTTQTALFENLMRALDRAPHRIEDVARIVEDLNKTPEGRKLLPEGFERIWLPIRAALESLQQ